VKKKEEERQKEAKRKPNQNAKDAMALGRERDGIA
jgi:hypothetical protein